MLKYSISHSHAQTQSQFFYQSSDKSRFFSSFFIHLLNSATFPYTPGTLAVPQPIPQATIPAWKYFDSFGETGHMSGLPPSPLQASFPFSPPAQTKVLCSLKFEPSRVLLRRFWQVLCWTKGTSTFFRIFGPSLRISKRI